jgi:outer membrane protein, heavy metal efflux system
VFRASPFLLSNPAAGRTARWLTLAILSQMCGCVGLPPRTDVRERAVLALGADRAGADVVLSIEGSPDDVTAVDANGPLPLAGALRLALESDPELQQALARVRAAEADSEQARLLPNPILSLVVRLRSGGGSPIITPALATDLAALLRRPRAASAVDNALRASASEALGAAVDLVAEVRKAYLDAQAEDAMLDALRQRGDIVRQMVGVAKARLEAGAGTKLDMLTLDAQRVAVEQEIADAESNRQTKRLSLLRLVGQPSGDIERKLDAWSDAATTLRAPESAWVSAAMAHRPEVQARHWELASLADREALAAFFPWDKLEAGAEAERDVQWSVGPAISVPLPIFDNGSAARRAALARRVEARHKLTEVRRQVIEETRKSYRTYIAARESLRRVRDELVPLQSQRRDQVQAAYKAGEVDLASLLLAENDLHEAKEKLVEIRRRAAVALADLEHSAGGAGIAEGVESDQAPATRPGPRN